MRVDWAIPCRFVEVNNGLATIAGGGIDHVGVQALPAPIGFMLAVRLVAPKDEMRGELRNVVTAPDGTEVSNLSGALEANMENSPEEWLAQLILPIAVQFMAEAAGTYTISVSVDAQSYKLPLHIIEGEIPGLASPE